MRNRNLFTLMTFILVLAIAPLSASAGWPAWLGGSKPAPTAAQVQAQQIKTSAAEALTWCSQLGTTRLASIKDELKKAAAASAPNDFPSLTAVEATFDQLAQEFTSCSGSQPYVLALLEAAVSISEAQCNGRSPGEGAKTLRHLRATAYWEGVRSSDSDWQESMTRYKTTADQRLATCSPR